MNRAKAGRRGKVLRLAALIVGVVCVGLVGAVYLLVHRTASPENLSSRLESMLGYPVEIREVSLRPWRTEARVGELKLGSAAAYDAMTVRLDPWAALSGEWRIREASLIGGVWVLPSAPEDWDPFLKGALAPIWIAKHAQVVTLSSCAIVGTDETEIIAKDIGGRFGPCEPLGDCHVAEIEGLTAGGTGFRLKASYALSERGDSLVVKELALSTPDLEFTGDALGTVDPAPTASLGLYCGDYSGGALMVSATVEGQEDVLSLRGKATLSNADAADLIARWSGPAPVRAGKLDIEVDLLGEDPDRWKGGIGGLITGGAAELEDAVIDASEPSAGVIPMAGSAGLVKIDCAAVRFARSEKDLLIHSLVVSVEGTEWRGSGRVGENGELTGVLLGDVPVSALSGGGSALMMVAGMLADGQGKVPLAFRVGGTMSQPVLRFDLDAVAREAADRGRPQAKTLLGVMSKEDKERLKRTVEEILGGLEVRRGN